MRVSIYEIAERLGLDAQQFRELVDEGRLDGTQLGDRDCIDRVRKMFLDAARIKPPTRH